MIPLFIIIVVGSPGRGLCPMAPVAGQMAALCWAWVYHLCISLAGLCVNQAQATTHSPPQNLIHSGFG